MDDYIVEKSIECVKNWIAESGYEAETDIENLADTCLWNYFETVHGIDDRDLWENAIMTVFLKDVQKYVLAKGGFVDFDVDYR